jgi:6-phosphogluconolactonase
MKLYAILTAAVLAWSASAKQFFVYFGTYTSELCRGIYVARLDADTGKISDPELAAETPSPCYLAVSPDGKFVYAANSVKTFTDEFVTNGGAVSAFAVDKSSGQLALLDQKSSSGAGPCHVSTDATGKILFVANYGDGSFKLFSIETNGAIGEDSNRAQRFGHGVNSNRQSSAHAHCICADPSNKYALVCDLGTDEVMAYPFEAAITRFQVNKAGAGAVPAGAGARHLAFGRDEKTLYVINEMGCSISRFIWDAKRGRLMLLETISALPPRVAMRPNYTAAEILVSPDGKFLYTTIRGHDSVSVFEVGDQGSLNFVQNVPSGGNVPRGLGLDPTGRWLFTANQKSNNAVEFAVDEKTGKISPTGRELKIGAPVDVKFVGAQ